MAPLRAEAPASITFEANGRCYGFDGCTQFFVNSSAADGRWEIVDGKVGRTPAGRLTRPVGQDYSRPRAGQE